MKTKFFVLLFMMGVSFFLKAEENFLHDRDTLNTPNGKIILEIRGRDKYTTVTDSDYGEFIYVGHPGRSVRVETQDEFGRYRMLKSHNDLSSKVFTASTRTGELAIFILKDNRPFTDELFILNARTKKLLKTGLFVKEAVKENGHAYVHIGRESENKSGTVIMGQKKYNYIEKPVEPWYRFENYEFVLDPEMTYEKFEYKEAVKKSEFKKIDLHKNSSYKITRSKTQKLCLSFSNDPLVCDPDALAGLP